MLFDLIRSGNYTMLDVIAYIFSTLTIIFLVLPLHECAHSFMAYKMGDDTSRRMGRMTLNPMKHIDYMGAALMLIIGFGWAKPVPVESRHFKNPRLGMALTAFAGPASNLLAALLSGLLGNGLLLMAFKNGWLYSPVISFLLMFFDFLVQLNIGLAVFNFIPIPPLDGSRILMAFLPEKAAAWVQQREMMISMLLFVLIMMGGLKGILTIASRFLYDKIDYLTSLPYLWAY